MYASYGEPTNTKYLKSFKLQRMMKDARLVQNLGGDSFGNQLSTTDIDLIIAHVTSKNVK